MWKYYQLMKPIMIWKAELIMTNNNDNENDNNNNGNNNIINEIINGNSSNVWKK